MAITDEKLITLSEAAELFQRRPTSAAIYRWANKGVRGVKLDSTIEGGRRLTSREAVARFRAALNQSPQQRAEAELITDGC